METTTMYTPQQNGVAERKNQTIMNMERRLVKEKCMSNTFWMKQYHVCQREMYVKYLEME
jgi:hypothetical protein